MSQLLINLMLALATGELVHNILEIDNVRRKVKRLDAYIHHKKFKELPINIDTRLKSYALSAVGFIVTTGVLFGIFSLLNLTGDGMLWFTIVALTLAYIATAFFLDKYHVEIERVTRPFMKK